MNKEQEIQKISITDSVVQALSQRIYSGQYKPGEKISTELQLCEELGVSRTCLREAFRVLQALGLVTVYRGRGAYVSENLPSDENTSWYDDTDAEFYDFIEVRMAIEPLSTQLAIERSTDEQIAELDTIHKSFLEAVDHKDMTKLIMLDELFHTTIVQMSGNKLLVNINKQLCQGNKKFTKDDITRASAEDIADCDYVLVGMTGAYSASYNSHLQAAFGAPRDVTGIEEFYYPASLQYAEYTADTARDPSISGNTVDGAKENRSYKGKTAPADANYGHLEALQYADSVAGEIPVIAAVSMERGMVWTEVEPLCDVIFVSYNAQKTDSIARMITGQLEPSGLLVFQQPASMEAVESQVDDVPRDVECYEDAAGNTYDFAFGMNWAGVISDERTAKYSADPLTKVQSHDFGDKLKTAAAE